MKRLTAFLLAIVLCLSMAACGGTGNETHDYVLSLLEQGEYDMAIHVIEGLRDGAMDGPQVQQEVQINTPINQENLNSADQYFEGKPETNGSDWFFNMDLINYSDRTLTLQTLLIRDWLREEERGTSGFEGEDLARLDLYQLELQPGQGRSWNDGHPVVPDLGRREYLFVFHDEAGEIVRFSFMYDMHDMLPEEGTAPAAPQQSTGDWTFPCVLENTSDTAWELTAMDITHLMNGEPHGTSIFEGEDLGRIGMGGLILQPGDTHSYMDGHPVVSDWNAAEYRFHFKDGNGQNQTLTFRFDNLDKQSQSTDYSQDQGQDLKTLRHGAAFETEVSKGVYWVPAVSLGESRYSNMDIHRMLGTAPEEKQQNISTLYEALQLYQVGNFTPSDDNIRLFEGGINWEHHKPGYHAVHTNTGCCATDSNWLRYILDGDYEDVGYIATSQRDGSGHIYNYIFHNGWYYIIDLTHYHATGPLVTAYEDGNMNSYRASDYILGNIHKVRDIQDYVDYVQRDFNDPPALMFRYTAENCLAVDSNNRQVIYEDTGKPFVELIFDNPSDNMEFVWSSAPKQLPVWQ